MRIALLCTSLLLAALSQSAHADIVRSHQLDGHTLTLTTDDGRVDLRVYGPDVIEAHYQPTGYRQLPSFTIVAPPQGPLPVLRESAERMVLDAGALSVVIDKSPLRLRYLRKQKPLLDEEAGLFATETLRGFRFVLDPDEKMLGGGERVLGMDRRGQRLPLYNKAAYGYGKAPVEQMYFSLPMVLSSRHYMLLFDNAASGALDIGKTEKDVLQFEAVAGRTAYVVIAGDSTPQIIENYVGLSGTQPLPPRWALGSFASRFGYRSQQEVLDTVKRYREQDFPLDALVLDLYWFGPDIKGHMGNLRWDRTTFPDPEGMLKTLRDQGVHTVLVTEPFVLTGSSRWDEAVAAGAIAKNVAGKPKTFDFYFGNTGLIDVFEPKAMDWFYGIYSDLRDQGVSGWWGDLGEPEVHPSDTVHANGMADAIHNAYGHQWAQGLHDRLVADQPAVRPFIMMRAGAPGSQRTGMMPWTGDVKRAWSGLVPQVELSLQMGLFGFGYTHSDLGGFAGGKRFDSELYVRWLQYGVFQPVFRPHAQDHIPSEPVYQDQVTQDLLRPFLKLRYQLLPYLYTMAYQNSRSGMPLMRPLFFADEANLSLWDRDDAYFFGNALLVAPVRTRGQQELTLALPAGVWIDFFTGQRYAGDTTVTVATPIDRLPVFARAGAFLPMIEPIANTDAYRSERLTLHYYADPSVTLASGQMYEDDGSSRGALEGDAHELLRFDAKQSDQGLLMTLRRSGGDYRGKPASRLMCLIVHHPQAMTVDAGGLVLPASETDACAGDTPATSFDADRGVQHIRFRWVDDAVAVRLTAE